MGMVGWAGVGLGVLRGDLFQPKQLSDSWVSFCAC